jgi:hypothetical protein
LAAAGGRRAAVEATRPADLRKAAAPLRAPLLSLGAFRPAELVFFFNGHPFAGFTKTG